jgi:predicted enzyme involved in methoxymalonyl-ACP biosynthesis
VISVESDGESARIVDFILSLPVMGRRVEERMLQVATEWAFARGLENRARHVSTDGEETGRVSNSFSDPG